MCIPNEQPASMAAALAMADAGLGYLRDPGAGSLLPSELGEMLEAVGVLGGKLAAARAAILSRFDAERGYAADGYGSATAWLKARGRMTGKAAGAETRRMRQFRRHPVIEDAVARGELSESWAGELAEWTRELPDDWRHDVDKLLADTASAGASLEDLAVVARAAYERWRQQAGPDDGDDDRFDDRFLRLGTTLDNAGRVNGSLTPECTAALQAVLDSLGKRAGPEDERTEAQRYHDALQLACELLLRARGCEWPGCGKPLAWCDIHHLRHKRDGGPTSVTECVALCQYHHDVCIHRQGWRLTLHPDGTTTAYGPKGQILSGSLHARGFT